MYSVVLLMALSSGVESPDFGKKKADCSGCTSCVGCTGCYTSCSGCTGCTGTVIYGCSSCSGCTGCYTSCSGCDGCTSSKRGLFGKKKAKDCSGCSSCTVSCTSSCHGYTGCTTSCTSSCHGTVIISCTGCTGSTGCTISCTGCTSGCGGVIVVPETKPMPKTGLDTPAPATISVKLPANAKLVIDDYVTSSTSTTRTFVTPALDPTKEYTYTLKAEINNNGKTEVKTETITVRGGRETAVTINFETGSVASK